MIKAKFRPYPEQPVINLRIFADRGGYKVPANEIYLEIRKWSNDGQETSLLLGSLDLDSARALANKILESVNQSRVVITDSSGVEHTFVNPQKVEGV